MLSEVDIIRNEYLPLLLNCHLKELDINLMKYIAPERILEKLLEIGDGLKCVSLSECSKEDELGDSGLPMPYAWSEHHIMELALLIPSVEELELFHTNCTNRVVEVIADNCPLLRVLRMRPCEITDEGIIRFCKRDINGCYIKNVQLEVLEISWTSVSETAVQFCLSYFASLKEIERDNLAAIIYAKHKGDISNRLPRYNLTGVGIRYPSSFRGDMGANIVDVITMLSSVCPKVTYFFHLSLTRQAELDACKAFAHLTSVCLEMDKRQKLDVFPFLAARGNILESLALAGCRLSVEWIDKCCPNLQALDLNDIEFLPFKPITAHFTKLVSLELGYIEEAINTAELSLCFILAASENLRRLFLPSFSISFDGIIDSVVAGEWCSKLRKLTFYDSRGISVDRIIKFISWAPHLETLDVHGYDMAQSMYPVLESLLMEIKPNSILVWETRM